ncbi:MAG: rod shape-determining protein MreC [Bryobacteraceae bacterium]|jgi:rod shape-determining protein MreC
MDSLFNRYRNVTVLLLVIFAQLILLAYQVKSNQDVRLIRVWAVTAVTPLARVIEGVRSGTVRVVENYVFLHNLRDENRELQKELGRLKVQNQYLKSELETADRVKALSAFQARSPSRMAASRVIGTGTGANSRVVFIDRGSRGGVLPGMAVITPDGIVGKVTAAYPTASQVLLITDPNFAAGVISQKHRVHGTVHGLGYSTCEVKYIQNEEQVETGERFFTSGDDGVFPKGLPVGAVTVARPGDSFKQVFLAPSGLQSGLEEVLVVLEGVHQPIPEQPVSASEMHLQPPPPPGAQEDEAPAAPGAKPNVGTEADRLRERYKNIGQAQGHKFGEGAPGSKPPDFNLKPEDAAAKAVKPAAPPPAASEQSKPAPQPARQP